MGSRRLSSNRLGTYSLGVAAAAAAKTGVKSKMRETISASVNSEPLIAAEGGLSLKERISKTISENIQKQSAQINKASGMAGAAAAAPAVLPVPRVPEEEPAPAGLDAALPPQEELPILLTQISTSM